MHLKADGIILLVYIEKDLNIISSRIEQSLEDGDVQGCYQQLAFISDGLVFRIKGILFQLSKSLPEEIELMRKSVLREREFGLVKGGNNCSFIEGQGNWIDMDDIAEAVYKTLRPSEYAIFSHTHWNVNAHPIPAHADVGFGDIVLFDFFRLQYPLLECRAAFNNKGEVRSIVYKGRVKE